MLALQWKEKQWDFNNKIVYIVLKSVSLTILNQIALMSVTGLIINYKMAVYNI